MVVVFAAAVFVRQVAVTQDAQLDVPLAWELERGVPQAAQPAAQDALSVLVALPAVHSVASLADPQVAPLVPVALLVARSDASPGDLRDALPVPIELSAVHSVASLDDPRDAPPVSVALSAVHSVASLGDPRDAPQADSLVPRWAASLGDPLGALPVPAYSLAVHSAAPLVAVHSDVSPGDPQADCLAVRLADDHY